MSIIDQHLRARQLNEVLAGRKFVDLEVTHHFDTQLRLGFSSFGGHDPTGKTIRKAGVDNEYVMLSLEGPYYFFWAGGETRYHQTPATLPKAYGLCLKVDDGGLLTIHIPGMGGALRLSNQAEYEAGLGFQTVHSRWRLSALDADRFTFAAFKTLLLARDTIACNAFSEIGDIGYLPDVLSLARIHPRTKVRKLDDEELQRLYEGVKQVNAEIFACHGEALEKDIFGRPGGYRRKMAGHLSRKPCPVCGENVQKQASNTGMAVYYCPQCQPQKI
jgi:formamidopyrimidine-DNA glycosylase